ncbi:MAG TPA: cellulose-binding domain-containing protein, partial [Bacillota bacterium]|nr:cellulose-binding domain-containing protein [Bacillota bacterium]
MLTTLRITYQIHSGDTTYFAFQVNYNGVDRKVKDITVKKVPLTIPPTPTGRTVTPTPTPRQTLTPTPTPTIVPGGYVVSYVIQSDWGNGATISVTITNKTPAAVNGWTLAFTFPGNQKITNIWNATFTQSGAAVSVKNAGFNATIPANGGSVNFGFNLNYSGSNGKPTSLTLNGTGCQIQ